MAFTSNGKPEPRLQATGQAAKVAPQSRADSARPASSQRASTRTRKASQYAADYGTRDTEAQLAAIEQDREGRSDRLAHKRCGAGRREPPSLAR